MVEALKNSIHKSKQKQSRREVSCGFLLGQHNGLLEETLRGATQRERKKKGPSLYVYVKPFFFLINLTAAKHAALSGCVSKLAPRVHNQHDYASVAKAAVPVSSSDNQKECDRAMSVSLSL